MGRKVLGYILLIIAVFLTLAIVGQLPALITVIIHFLAIFRGRLSADQVGFALGQMVVWVIHFVLTILAWKYGLRFVRKFSN